jgi:8-oxo-dGTP pyrophosphatase MutT (NUDIX family)
MVFPEFAHQVQPLESMPEPKGMWAKGAPVVHNQTGQTGVIHTQPVEMYGGKMMKVKWKGNPKPETLTERQVHLAEQRGQEKGTAHPDAFDEETPDLGNDDQSYVPSMEKEGAKEITVAGLAVVAQDTGRVLMLQRAVDDDDPASGKWEFPGGHLEEGESPLEGAIREWKEEVGCPLPPGEVKASQVQPNGIYQLFVYVVESEDVLDINGSPDDRQVLNPDDPDQDNIEVVAWWSVKDIKDNPAVRKEVQSTDWSIFSKALRKTSAKVSKYLQNPRDKTDDWHHGSPKEFDNPEPGQEEGLNEHRLFRYSLDISPPGSGEVRT